MHWAWLLTLLTFTFAPVARPLAVNWPELRPSPFVRSPDGIQQTVDEELDPEEQERRKYFHEPSHTLDLEGHYDARFFSGVVTYDDRLDTLRHLIRSYLSTMDSLQAPTWIAHGTLLGWQWNKQMLPWDWDLDVQVTDDTLKSLLARGQNGSFHHYSWPPKTQLSRVWQHRPRVERKYMLDVSPHSADRNRGDAMNVIDARWIDTRNGLFVDITVLAETHPDRQPGVWACKNYHRYHTTQIWPLKLDSFEGVPALVPHRPGDIMLDEYGPDSLVVEEWEDHRWDPRAKRWKRKEEPIQPDPGQGPSMEAWRWL